MGYVHHGFVWHIGKLRYFQMHSQVVGYGTTKCISALFYQSRWKHPNLLAKLSGCCYGNISCNELELYLDGAQNKRENKWTCVSMCVCVCVCVFVRHKTLELWNNCPKTSVEWDLPTSRWTTSEYVTIAYTHIQTQTLSYGWYDF